MLRRSIDERIPRDSRLYVFNEIVRGILQNISILQWSLVSSSDLIIRLVKLELQEQLSIGLWGVSAIQCLGSAEATYNMTAQCGDRNRLSNSSFRLPNTSCMQFRSVWCWENRLNSGKLCLVGPQIFIFIEAAARTNSTISNCISLPRWNLYSGMLKIVGRE